MSSEDTKILQFNQYQKSDKLSYIAYTYLQSLVAKMNGCKHNPEKSTIRIGEQIPSGFSVSTTSSFKGIENKHDVSRGKGCMK